MLSLNQPTPKKAVHVYLQGVIRVVYKWFKTIKDEINLKLHIVRDLQKDREFLKCMNIG